MRLKLDAASLGLAIRDCKERGFDRLTYAPKAIRILHMLSRTQNYFLIFGRSAHTMQIRLIIKIRKGIVTATM